jgi:hypothetical protein
MSGVAQFVIGLRLTCSYRNRAVAIQNANLASLSSLFAASVNRRFQFQKRSQLFIRTHNEAPSVVAMRVNDPDCAPPRISG